MKIKRLYAKNVFLYDELDLKFDNEIYLILACTKEKVKKAVNGVVQDVIENNFDKSNGVGKSAIIELIMYALFGKTLRGENEISKYHSGKFYIELEFDDNKIIRTEKGITLYIKGEKYERKKMQGQSLIDDFLKLDFDMLNYTNIFTADTNFFKLDDGDKKEVLMKLINIDFIDEVYDKVEERAKNLRESKLDNIIEIYTNELKNIDEVTKQENNARKELESVQSLEEGIKKFIEFKNQLKVKVPNYIELIDTIKERRNKLVSMKGKLQAEAPNLEIEDLQKELYKIMDEISRLNAQNKELTNKKNKLQSANKCPVLEGIDCEKLTLENKQKMISGWETEILKLQDELKSVTIKKDNIQKSISCAIKAKEDYDELKATYEEDKKRYYGDKDKSIVLRDEIRKLAIENKDVRKFQHCAVSLQDIRVKQMNHANYLAQLKMLVDKQEKLAEYKKKNDNLHAELTTLEILKKIFSKNGLKQFIVSKILNFLETKINEMIINVFDDISLKFITDFSVDKKNMLKIIVMRKGNEVSLNEFSTGQKRMFEVVFQVALYKLFMAFSNQDINFMFFDEVFDALDACNSGIIIDILKLLKEDNKTMFIVSHKPYIQQYFDKSIIIANDGVNSWIERQINDRN